MDQPTTIAIIRAKQNIAKTMLLLHSLKAGASPSGRKQLAALIVELGETRERVDKVEK